MAEASVRAIVREVDAPIIKNVNSHAQSPPDPGLAAMLFTY